MPNYNVFEYVSTDTGDRVDILIANQLDSMEAVLEYLASIGNVVHLVPPRTYTSDPEVKLLVEDITWAITVELKSGSWVFHHIYNADLIS